MRGKGRLGRLSTISGCNKAPQAPPRTPAHRSNRFVPCQPSKVVHLLVSSSMAASYSLLMEVSRQPMTKCTFTSQGLLKPLPMATIRAPRRHSALGQGEPPLSGWLVGWCVSAAQCAGKNNIPEGPLHGFWGP